MSIVGHVAESESLEVTVQESNNHIVLQMSLPVSDLADQWQNSLARQLGEE